MQEIETQNKEYLTQIKKILGDKWKELKPNKSPYDFYYENKYDNFRETIILDLQFPEDEWYYCIEKKNSLSIIFVMKYKNVSLTEFLEKTKQVKKIGER